MVRFNWKRKMLAVGAMLLGVLTSCGIARAQDGGGIDLGMGTIGTLIASVFIPYLVALIKQRNFSQTVNGWIALVVSLIIATAATFATGGLGSEALGEDRVLVTIGTILGLSQIIHRLFHAHFKKIEEKTSVTPLPAELDPVNRVTPQPQSTKEIVADAGEQVFLQILRKQTAERGAGNIAELLLGGTLGAQSLQPQPTISAAPLPEIHDTDDTDADILPEFLKAARGEL